MTSNTPSKYYNTSQYTQATQRVTSRRAKVEQKKLLTQSVIFGVLAVLSLIFFGLVVIPGVIRFVGGIGDKTNIQVTDDGVSPQTPTLDTPLTATTSASITLKGYQQPNHEIVILNNSNEVARVKTIEDGSFSADVDLEKGENKFVAYAINSQNKESGTTPDYVVVFDNEPPKLEITSPTEGQSVQGKKNQNFAVNGMTDPNTRVYLNDRLLFVKTDGSFSGTTRLENGDNNIAFKAIDQAGNITEKTVKVSFAE